MEQVCFVIMGFGIKNDFRTGREIDLDKTYKNIIKPVFEELGFICKRADDVKHSGVIDIPMYEYILKSDFVIADISTLNPNVMYELGVRHAVRKNSTLIIAEKYIDYPFDISHVVFDSYEHLGKGIDFDEVNRMQTLLKDKVSKLMDNPSVDSPLYTFFSELNPPSFNNEEIKIIKDEISDDKSPSQILNEAEDAKNNKEFELAISLFKKASDLIPRNEFLIQRLALVTYKSKLPNEGTALFEAETILNILNPETTTDPETLGLSGAINKRLFEFYNDKKYLTKSLWFYKRGFYIRQDYYNGINLALVCNLISNLEDDQFESYSTFGEARKVRRMVISICEILISQDNFSRRDDKIWIYLSLSEAYFGLEDEHNFIKYFDLANECGANYFAIETFNEQIEKIRKSLVIFKTKWEIL